MLSSVRDGWLSGVTGKDCYKVEGHGTVNQIQSCLGGCIDGFFFTKIAVSAVAQVETFISAGFRVVDTNVALMRAASKRPSVNVLRHNDEIEISPARADEYSATQEHGRRGLLYSRFHLDPSFPRPIANEIKREWIRSYCERKRGECLLVARLHGRVVGFLAVLLATVDGKDAAIIDLIAVDSRCRGQGVGFSLVRYFIRTWSKHVQVLRVGTQIVNTPSLKLYHRCGFSVTGANYVLHAGKIEQRTL